MNKNQKIVLGIFLIVLIIFGFLIVRDIRKIQSIKETEETSEIPVITEKPAESEDEWKAAKEEAGRLAMSYDYDGAVELLDMFPDNEEKTELIKTYQDEKDACVPVDINKVTHIFYHTLVVDPKRCFKNQTTNPQAAGNNQWMTTVDEFNAITQEMYDRGYVLVSIHDLVEETVNKKGKTVYKPGTILLPKGKKAFVLSLDDLSYYHSYDGYGFASKLVLDKDGKVVNEYINKKGKTLTGAYDCVPLLDQFIEEHPDASYHGAKGLVALTGYNGVLGYRTDISYKTKPKDLDADKLKWLEEHPDFDLKEERAEAKKVADAMKENGWEFASHTWGHLRIGDITLKTLKADTRRWRKNVEPIVGSTDAIVFAHGQDLEEWGSYDKADKKYQFLKKQGYSIFCNVDASQYMTWLGKDYLRQGRRNLDGYRIYYNAVGKQDNLSDLFDAAKILDPLRPPVPEL